MVSVQFQQFHCILTVTEGCFSKSVSLPEHLRENLIILCHLQIPVDGYLLFPASKHIISENDFALSLVIS